MDGTTRPQRDPFAMWAGWVLLAVAFAGSYMHVVQAVSAWGQKGWMAYAIAAMPEVTVLIGMRKVLTGAMTPIMWVFLATAGVFTLGGNLNSAQHSIGGYIAAGWPAWSAVGALIFAGVHARDEGAPVEARTATEVTFRRGTSKTLAESKPPVTRPVRVAEVTEVKALVRPRVALTGGLDPGAPGHHDPVAAALLAEWTPGQTLTKAVKVSVMASTGVSEKTVKRRAVDLSVQGQVTS